MDVEVLENGTLKAVDLPKGNPLTESGGILVISLKRHTWQS